MQEQNSSQTEVIISTPTETQPIEEPIAEVIEEVAETVSNSEVEIAEIVAARDIAIAAENADVERTRIEAQERATTTVAQNEEEKWQEITSLKEQVSSLSERVSNLTSQLIPPQSEEVTEVLIPQSTSDETSETLTEALQENVGERPGQEAEALVRRVRRAI